MRPLILVLEAFGSYGHKTTIDFTKVHQNIFLISGNTGSGKSTIFDGIVFALYGEASSNENKKDGEVLQSQYASVEVKPCVTFTFEEEGKTYTVTRVPRHYKLLKRGKNAGKYALETGRLEVTLPDGTVLSSQQAQKKIDDLVKLTKAQFMQVVMLAQGEFMEVLRASTNDKKEIFRKLFHTEKYERMAGILAQKKKDLEKDMDVQRQLMQASVAQLDLSALSEKHHELVSQIQQGMYSSLSSFLDVLRDDCIQLENDLKESNTKYLSSRQKLQKAQVLLQQGKTVVSYYETLQQVEQQLSDLKKSENEYLAKKKTIENIQKAVEISSLFTRWKDAEKNYTSSLKDYEEAVGILPVVQKTKEEAERAAHAYEDILQKETASFAKTEQDVQQCLSTLKQLSESRKTLACKQQKKQHAQKLYEEILKELDTVTQRLKEVEIVLEKTRNCEEEYTVFVKKETEFQQSLTQYGAYTELQKSVNKTEKDYTACTKKYLSEKEKYEQARNTYSRMFERYLDNQAGMLAKTLEEGKPCPVCGSVHHPLPALLEDTDVQIDKDMLDTLKKAENDAQKICTDTAGKLQGIKATLDTCIAQAARQYAELQKILQCEDVGKEIEKLKKEYIVQKQEYQKQIAVHKQAILDQKTLSDRHTDLLGRKEKGNTCLLEVVHTMDVLQQQIQSATQNLKYTDVQQAEHVLQIASGKLKEVQDKNNLLQKESISATQKYTATSTVIQKTQQKLPRLEKMMNETREVCEQKVQKENLLEWKEFVSLDKAKMEAEVESYRTQLDSLRAKKEEYTRLLQGTKYPDISVLENDVKVLEEQGISLNTQCTNLQIQLERNRTQLVKLTEEYQKSKEKISAYEHVSKLHKWISGNVTNGRMDLETYVQRYYLQQILRYANTRFYAMTMGQYALRLMEDSKASTGKNKGLDLMVYSYVTDTERDVKTLSGGESFMAALTLALGMADQIQQTTSAIHLDMLFIDEGFGSLDDHSRTQAVEVLKTLAQGNKLIGIISHVSELKTQLETQLTVEKKEDGSHIAWKIS